MSTGPSTGGRIVMRRAREVDTCDGCGHIVVAGDLIGHDVHGWTLCRLCIDTRYARSAT